MVIWKIMLIAAGSGTLFGTIGGTSIDPALKPPPEQPWRHGLGPQQTPMLADPVAVLPQDLSPQGWTYGATRAFPQDARRQGARRTGYRLAADAAEQGWSYAAMPEDEPVRASEAAPVADEAPVVEAAAAARDAALDATDQGLDPAPAEAPAI